jgi:hypothetical protein
MVESVSMERIPGRLMVDLLPDGKVRLRFSRARVTRTHPPVRAIDLDAAEVLFRTCGLSVERTAAL